MNGYALGILISLLVYIVIGNWAGRKVKDVDDFLVAGRQAPTLLIVGTLVASAVSTSSADSLKRRRAVDISVRKPSNSTLPVPRPTPPATAQIRLSRLAVITSNPAISMAITSALEIFLGLPQASLDLPP